mgnify:FL=1
MNHLKEKVEAMISYIFGKYDMRKGENNKLRMQKLTEFCMKDINKHPTLIKELNDKTALEYFVIQSIIYMMDLETVF